METVLKYLSAVWYCYNAVSMHNIDRSEIRTRATEVTGALNQRLRPLGHPSYDTPPVNLVECKWSIFVVRYMCNRLYNRQYFQYTVITLRNSCLIQSFFICVRCKFPLSKWLLLNKSVEIWDRFLCRMLLLMSIKRKLIQGRFKCIVTL